MKKLIEEEGRGKDFTTDPKLVDMAGLRRVTEADRKGDLRSLERALSRTLYLVVRRKRAEGKDGGFWGFPSGAMAEKEGLKEVSWKMRLQFAFDLLNILSLFRLLNGFFTRLADQTCTPGSWAITR